MRYLLFAGLLLFVACNTKKEGDLTPDTATSGILEFVADEELRPVIDSLVIGFNAENPQAKVTVKYLPATQALDAMLQRSSRLVIIGRALNVKELQTLKSQQVELFDFDIALNSVACIVSAKSGTLSLDPSELRDNIIGSKTSYTQVLGPHFSSTEAILDSIFHADTATVKGKVIRYSTVDSIISHVKSDPNSVGYISASWLNSIQTDSAIKVLDVGIMLHPAYVYQGKYPLVSRVMGYTMEPANTLPRGFLAYAMSANGQRVFLNYDLVPRTQIIRLVPPNE